LDQSFQLAQRWLLHDFMPSRIDTNKRRDGKALSDCGGFLPLHQQDTRRIILKSKKP
jgi:hypothetical protein